MSRMLLYGKSNQNGRNSEEGDDLANEKIILKCLNFVSELFYQLFCIKLLNSIGYNISNAYESRRH